MDYSDSKLVEFSVLVSTSHVLRGVVNSVDCLVKVKTGHSNTQKERAPLNIAIVLDKSGSMQTENKLENAKESIVQIIQNLGGQDTVHLVCYDTSVQTIFENGNSANSAFLISKVRNVCSGSSTNLWGGLERGVDILTRNKCQGFNSRVFLFSDGLVNAGETDKKTILRKVSDTYENHSIQVSAFGLGDDFDEDLMKGIADKGIGAYFFIENSNAIPTFVNFALTSLQKVAGTGAIVKARGRSCGIVKNFYGNHDLIQGAILGDLREDNLRTLMFQAEISPMEDTPIKPVIECELSYEHDVDGVRTTISETKEITVEFTTNPQLVKTSENKEVKIQTNLRKISEIDKELAEAMTTENEKQSEKLLQQEISILQEVLDIDEKEFGGANKIAQLLKQSKKNLEDLREKGATKQQIKEVHHRGYTASRG